MSAPTQPGSDRAMVARLLATLTAVVEPFRVIVAAASENPQLRAQLADAIAQRDEARQAQLLDEQGDLADLGPLAEAVESIRSLVVPAAEVDADVTPVTDLADVPAVADGSLDPGDVTGRTDAPDGDAAAGGDSAGQ